MFSNRARPPQGQWFNSTAVKPPNLEETNRIAAKRKKCLAITGLACLALASMIAGGCLFSMHINTVAAASLLGGGCFLYCVHLIVGGLMLCRQLQQDYNPAPISQAPIQSQLLKENPDYSSYKIVSWNMGTLFPGYAQMLTFKNKIEQGSTLATAYSDFLQEESVNLGEEEKERRKALFAEAFANFDEPDIICLQQTSEFSDEYLDSVLPEGYTHFSHTNAKGLRNCTVAWRSEKFSKLNHAIFDSKAITSLTPFPDTMVLLKDNETLATICVSSLHLCSFSLAYEGYGAGDKAAELERAAKGDGQLAYNINTMANIEANLYVCAGGFNATEEHYPSRLKIIKDALFIFDGDAATPTVYDDILTKKLETIEGEDEIEEVEPLPVRTDYIFAKGHQKQKIDISKKKLRQMPLNKFERPSKHLAIAAKVVLE